MLTILDLCGGTGAWSAPYREAGYAVVVADLLNGIDVRTIEKCDVPIHGILAAPPCTHLSSSGARWWAEKGEAALLEALAAVDACLRAVVIYRPAWWCLENPTGRLSRYLGEPVAVFDPCDYGDPYTKRTCLWGSFTMPTPAPVPVTMPGYIHRMPPSEDRWQKRSATPAGFAQAFFEANP